MDVTIFWPRHGGQSITISQQVVQYFPEGMMFRWSETGLPVEAGCLEAEIVSLVADLMSGRTIAAPPAECRQNLADSWAYLTGDDWSADLLCSMPTGEVSYQDIVHYRELLTAMPDAQTRESVRRGTPKWLEPDPRVREAVRGGVPLMKVAPYWNAYCEEVAAETRALTTWAEIVEVFNPNRMGSSHSGGVSAEVGLPHIRSECPPIEAGHASIVSERPPIEGECLLAEAGHPYIGSERPAAGVGGHPDAEKRIRYDLLPADAEHWSERRRVTTAKILERVWACDPVVEAEYLAELAEARRHYTGIPPPYKGTSDTRPVYQSRASMEAERLAAQNSPPAVGPRPVGRVKSRKGGRLRPVNVVRAGVKTPAEGV